VWKDAFLIFEGIKNIAWQRMDKPVSIRFAELTMQRLEPAVRVDISGVREPSFPDKASEGT
jgi:hypothetical protein